MNLIRRALWPMLKTIPKFTNTKLIGLSLITSSLILRPLKVYLS